MILHVPDETEILNPDAIYDRGRYVRLTAFIAEKEETHPDPRIYVEQRVYQGNQEMIMIHELIFGGMIQVGIEYVFTACGDEDVHLGKRDLRLTIKSVSVLFYTLCNSHERSPPDSATAGCLRRLHASRKVLRL